MAVTIAGQWANASGPAPGTLPATPPAASLPVTASNTSGDWMVAICAWRQAAAGQGVTVSVGDDAGNRWEPLGAPAADSPAAGTTRVSLWYAPAARARSGVPTTVMLAPTGLCAALAMAVLDVAGLAPWDQLAFLPVTAYGNAAASLGLASPVPLGRQPALAITALASDLSTAAISFTGAGWAPLTGVSTVNGTDHTADLELAAQWQVITAAQAVTWASSPACDLAGILGAVVVNAAAPVAANPNWPIVITEVAPGAGVTTPPSQLAWQSASHRNLGFTVTQGQPYLLGGLQAAQGGLSLDNPDLAVTPPGAGVWAGLDSGAPVRVRAILPASATPHYVPFNGYLQQAPTSFDTQLRGTVQATVTDAYAYATASLAPCLQAEILSEPSLYALWPLNDPPGSQAASNRAPGNPNPLLLVASKFGTAPATEAFGANTGALRGDSGSGMFSQTGVPASGLNGWSLGCTDANYPPIGGGVTAEIWSQFTSSTPSSGNVLTLMTSALLLLQCQTDAGGNLEVSGHQTPSLSTTVTLTTLNFLTAPLWHLAVWFDRSTYAIYVNGALVTSGSWTYRLPPAFTQVWVNGNWGTYVPAFGKLFNGYSAYAAIFSGRLPAARIASHYQAGIAAFAGEYAHQRVERILGYAGLTGRRVIVPEAPGMPGGFTVPLTTPPGDVTPMTSMATLGGTSPSVSAPGQPGFSPGSGTQASSALAATAASTLPAVFTAAPSGGFSYLPRSYAANQPVKWVLGDGAGEVPVWPDASFPYDPGTVRNIVQLTQPDTGTVTVPGVSEAASQAQYGGQSYQVTAYLQDDITAGYTWAPTMADLASWVAQVNAAPRLRAQVTVKASHLAPALGTLAWPFVLGAAPGDMVTVNARPPTSPGAVISVTARIAQVTRKLVLSPEGTEGSCTVILDSAPEENTLTCDDPVRGQLSGVNVLGW